MGKIQNKIWVMWTGAIRVIVNKLYFLKKLYHFYEKLKKLSKH